MPVVKKYGLIVVVLLVSCTLTCRCQPREMAALALTADSLQHYSGAPPNASFVISEIFINGNHKTKPYIIERELPFRRGDSVYLPDLVAKFQRARELLINTKLFTDVVVSLKSFRGYLVDVQIDVKERWYIFPIPYFKPVDRNLSAWAEKDYSLSRVNYGLKLYYNNVTGRNDKMRMYLVSGYTRQVELNYDQPYADKTLKNGYGIGFSYSALKEINSTTVHNQQQFLKADSIPYSGKYLSEQWAFSVGYSYRPAIRTRHMFRVGYGYNIVDSAVMVANAKYFTGGRRKINYPEFSYTLDYQNADYVPYILKGFMGNFSFARRGVGNGMNLWQLNGSFTKGWRMANRVFYGLQGYGLIKLPFDQPYFTQRFLGYGDIYLRGLEKFVVDGVAGGMMRHTLRWQLAGFTIRATNLPTLNQVPIKVYAKTYADMGYSYNRDFLDNSLVNRMLYTAGAGIDVVTVYDLVFRFEYSFNQLGQPGFFFHVRNDF